MKIKFGHVSNLLDIPKELEAQVSSEDFRNNFLKSKNGEVPVSDVSFENPIFFADILDAEI